MFADSDYDIVSGSDGGRPDLRTPGAEKCVDTDRLRRQPIPVARIPLLPMESATEGNEDPV